MDTRKPPRALAWDKPTSLIPARAASSFCESPCAFARVSRVSSFSVMRLFNLCRSMLLNIAYNWGPLLYAEPKEHDLIAVHSGSSSLISKIQWHRLWGQFHTKRRRSKIKVRYSHAECRHIAKNLTRSERAMRGPDIHQDTLFSTASPAGRVPKDHSLRQLVDTALLALDEDFDDLYADAANGS